VKKTNIMLCIIFISFGLFAHQDYEDDHFRKEGDFLQKVAHSHTSSKQFYKSESTTSRDVINDIIDLVDMNNLNNNVLDLTNFNTRYYAAENRYEVAGWLHDKFIEYGFDQQNVVIDSFNTQNEWHRNVYGVIPGSMHPDKYILIGSHYDSTSETPMTIAPGADDNATSVSAILEIARIMIDQNFQPEVSLMFTLFGSKEPGRYGSEYLTEKMILEETDLSYALNLEMLGFNSSNPDDWTISFNRYTGSEYLYDFLINIMEEYTTLNAGTMVNNYNFYDCWNFFQNGFNVVMFTAEEFNMAAHSSGDVIENIDFTYMTELSKLACASLAKLSIMPQMVDDVSIFDDGSGNGLFLTWSPSEDTDFDYFEISYGIESGIYTETVTTTGTEILLFGLTEGQEYFIGIRSVDTDNNFGFFTEVQGTSMEIPLTPNEFHATPSWDGVEINWAPNTEMDIAGYWIYRSDTPEGTYNALNPELVFDTDYLDENVLNGTFYYYKVSAEDFDGNESELSDYDRSRIISFDQGLLVIDDTVDGTGSFMQPTDVDCDQFYTNVLAGFSYEVIDVDDYQEIRMDDLCVYSSVLWYIDDNTSQSNIGEYQNDMKQFLDAGGQLLLSGYKTVSKICGINGYPVNFTEGDFGWDYLKLSSVNSSNTARFNCAINSDGADIFVDESKTLEVFDYHLIGVEGVEVTSENNYTYGCDYELGSPFAVLSGLPVDSFYDGNDFKLVLLTFPLYYMYPIEVSDLLNFILSDVFDEPVSAEYYETLKSSISLDQNFPNPFNPKTKISFSLPVEQKIELNIFNTKGQMVRQLASEQFLAGQHSVVWNGKDDNNKTVSSGIYFYKINAGEFQATRKMLLIK